MIVNFMMDIFSLRISDSHFIGLLITHRDTIFLPITWVQW